MTRAAPPRRLASTASRLVRRVMMMVVVVMVVMMMVMHHVVVMVVHRVVMVVVRSIGEGRDRDHRKGDAGDRGGEGLDQVRLHNVFDPDLRRVCRQA